MLLYVGRYLAVYTAQATSRITDGSFEMRLKSDKHIIIIIIHI
jgi:hypothetical protein